MCTAEQFFLDLKAHNPLHTITYLATADGCFGARAQYRKMAESEQHVSVLLPPCISPTSPSPLAVHHVVYLVDETDDYFRYFACYEYAKRNKLQN